MRFNWGTGIALVYGIFAACTSGFVVFAMRHPAQLVSEDYYASSLEHDHRLAAIRNASLLPPETLHASDVRTLKVLLPPAMRGDVVGSVQLYRPADATADRTIALAPDGHGRQHIPLDGLAPGRWQVRMQWTSGGQHFYRELALWIP